MRSHGVIYAAALPLTAALTVGCWTSTPTPPGPTIPLDACAERLHDICGSLLLYYSTHRKLPAKLDELAAGDSLAPPPPVCPLSGKPYVYRPAGLPLPDRQGRLILYDPEPVHSGMRWGILVGEAAGKDLITATVILVSEKELTSPGGKPKAGSGTAP